MSEAKVLIVEDDWVVAEDIKKRLKYLGYGESAMVPSGEDAINEIKENSPDLVLMDIMLKGKMDGIETAERIRTTFNIPVVYVTAYVDVEMLERAKITEPFGYIIKPFEDKELQTTIEIALFKHKAEKALRESEELHRITLSNISDSVFITDNTGAFTYICPNVDVIFGYSNQEVDSFGNISKLLGNNLCDRNKLKASGEIKNIECEIKDKTGETHVLLVNMKKVSIKGGSVLYTCRDISERKKIEKELQESEEKYRTLFEDSRDAIFINTKEGCFIDVNQSMLDLFGYSKEELIRTNIIELYVNPDDRAVVRGELDQKGSVRDYEIRFKKKDGTEMECLLTATVRWGDDRSVLGYQGIIRDVSEKKKLEAQLQQAQKMEAMGTLAGGLAHDFNNLLMGIQGNASLMLLDADPAHSYYEKLKAIEKMVQSGSQLTRQLLGYARKGRYEAKPINLNKLVEESSDTFGRTRKEIIIQREFEEELSTIDADQVQIEQVLLNLYVNAADAMPGGGELILKTRKVTHEDMKDKLYNPRAGKYVQLNVTDTGMGMDKKTQEHIFDPFFTTKEMGRGTGLGLASAYGIIKAHGGYIDVHSKIGEGATFIIYLPASEQEVVKEKAFPEDVLKGTETVFLVDDEDMIIDVAEQMLKTMGYKVLFAKSGKKAIEVFKTNKGKIDMVILDMIMPGTGGGEVYDKMREISPSLKVLLSSGYSIDGQAEEILQRGCDGFIQKPFNISDLSQKIREILDNKKS